MRKMLTIALTALTSTLLAEDAFAQKEEPIPIGLHRIGGRVMYTSPSEDGIDSVLGFGVHADMGDLLVPNLAIYPSISYWKQTTRSLYGIELEGVEFDFSEVALNVDARYFIPRDGTTDIYVGGGIGAVTTSLGADVAGVPGAKRLEGTETGANLLAGLEAPVSEGVSGFLEIRHQTAGLGGTSVLGGITFDIP